LIPSTDHVQVLPICSLSNSKSLSQTSLETKEHGTKTVRTKQKKRDPKTGDGEIADRLQNLQGKVQIMPCVWSCKGRREEAACREKERGGAQGLRAWEN
jgi:hypothetical protein